MEKQKSLEGKTSAEVRKMFPEKSWTAMSTDRTIYANAPKFEDAINKLREKGYQGTPILIQTNSSTIACYFRAA